MKTDLIHNLTETFEAHAQETEGGIEFWLARDLQYLLGYAKWDNFLNVVSKAKTACEVSGHTITDHFADVGKMVDLGSGSQREVDDIMLTTRSTAKRDLEDLVKKGVILPKGRGRGAYNEFLKKRPIIGSNESADNFKKNG